MMPNGKKPIVIESTAQELTETRSDNKLYKGQSEEVSGKISALVAEKMLLLADIVNRGKTNLKDLEEVQAVSIAYMESCRRSDTIPTFEGLCVSMGYSRQWIYAFIRTRKSDDPVANYLEEMRTLFADIMTTASLKRYVDCATTIFSLKNMTGLGYSDKGDAIPENTSAEYDSEHSADYYRKKYGDLLPE